MPIQRSRLPACHNCNAAGAQKLDCCWVVLDGVLWQANCAVRALAPARPLCNCCKCALRHSSQLVAPQGAAQHDKGQLSTRPQFQEEAHKLYRTLSASACRRGARVAARSGFSSGRTSSDKGPDVLGQHPAALRRGPPGQAAPPSLLGTTTINSVAGWPSNRFVCQGYRRLPRVPSRCLLCTNVAHSF